MFNSESRRPLAVVGPLDRAAAISRQVTLIIAAIGVLGILLVGITTMIDILIFRTILNRSLPGFNELLQTVFAVAIAATLASGLAERASLKVDIFTEKLTGSLGRWLPVAGEALLLIFYSVLAWACYGRAMLTLLIGGQTIVLQLPTGPFMVAISVFVAICVPVQLISYLISIRDAVCEGSGESNKSMLSHFIGITVIVALFSVLVVIGVEQWGSVLTANPAALAIGGFALVWVIVLLGFPVGAALAMIGFCGAAMTLGWGRSLSVMGSETTGLFMNGELAVIPLFLVMGAFASAAGLSSDIYRLAQAVLGSRRGGLAMATVGACAGFGALTGSSVATVATIGSVAMPEMKQRGYAPSLSAGCIAAGSTLGQLIPPSTVIVIYAILVEESIGRLYVAVLGPALLTILLYLGVIAIMVRLKPELAPGRVAFNARDLCSALLRAWVVIIVFGVVIGGIYMGIFTATEAASIGAVATFSAAALRGKLHASSLWKIAGETTSAVAMLYPLIIGALIFTFFLDLSGLPVMFTNFVSDLGWTPLATIIMLIAMFIFLGTVMDSVAVLIMTAGLVTPLVVNLGYDPIWWGVMMLIVVELGVVTPPFGLNLFMLRSIEPSLRVGEVYRGVAPFVAADIIKIIILLAVPAITLWLPSTMH